VIKEIYFLDKYIFLYGSNEWIMRDLKLGLVEKKKSDKYVPKRVAIISDNLCVVHHYNNISVWNLKEHKVESVIAEFTVSDFCLLNGSLLMVGDSAMRVYPISK
jgi:hypothetical protein